MSVAVQNSLEAMSDLTIQGRPVPTRLTGELVEADINGDLHRQLEKNGYLLIREAHDPEEVILARKEVLARLAEVDEILQPFEDAIASGRSRRAEAHKDLATFWKSVSEGRALRRVINGPRITTLMTRLFGEPAAHFSFAWLRAMTAGRASPLHVDHPYMNRGSKRLVTVWTPLGQINRSEGALYIVEGSHRWQDLRERFEGLDVDLDPTRPGHMVEHPVDFADERSSRLLTTTFQPGDCMVFGMFTAHAAFDNGSTSGKVRVSCDTRFQPAAEPMDERFSGPNPPAHGDKGYGCLAAAQPMTAPMLKR